MQKMLRDGLLAGEIHWWFSHFDDSLPDTASNFDREILSPDEHDQRMRFHYEPDRNLYAGAHLLLRFALSQYREEGPDSLRFKMGDFGRPELDCLPRGPRLRFSLSHTRNLATCAVALDDDIGVDAERNIGRLFPEIGESFAPSEQEDLKALPIQAQTARFLEYWTLKESYLKARGLGLQIPLDSFWFAMEENRWSLSCRPEIDSSPDSWRFVVLTPTSTHLAALAIRDEGHVRKKIQLVAFDREQGSYSIASVGGGI
jgi:4'-phosphopantetheinyl transferase